MARPKYPDSIKEGFKSFKAAKAVIKSLYEESVSLKESLKITQDELENWKNKYHEADKDAGILGAKLQSTVFSEILKFISSGLLVAAGINLLTDGKIIYGVVLMVAGLFLYIGIIVLGRFKK